MSIDPKALQDSRIVKALDELTENFSPDDLQMVKQLLSKHKGNELDLLLSLMDYTHRTLPVPVRTFVEEFPYLGLRGQVYPKLLEDLEELFESGSYNEAVLTGAIGWGKALDINTPIPTEQGWTPMEEIKVGDKLFDADGNLCNVTNVTPVMKNRPCYSIRFSDGSNIIADADHQWVVSSWGERSNSARQKREVFRQVLTTKELIPCSKHGAMNNWAVELAMPINLSDQNLLIDPYVLGAWLGDGSAADGRITCFDSEIIDKVRSKGYEVREAPATPNLYTIIGLKIQLRETGVLSNKHVPSIYLRGSTQQRTELLKGLMDTDGTVEPCGRVEFTNTNIHLAEAVYELAASLGCKPIWWEGNAKLNENICGKKYRVRFTPDTPVFCLSRKLDLQRTPGKQASRNHRRYITEISPVESVPVKCVQVDSPTHTFLIGKSFVPTHNSTFAEISICRMIYEVSCFKNPQRAFGLMDGSVIAFINVSLNKDAARKVVFQGLRNKLMNSQYFRETFPITAPLAVELRLLNNVWVFPVASGEHSILGHNVFGGVMDEVNFMSFVEDSKRARGDTYDQASKLQTALIRRMKSRYMKKGKLPGILVQVSSSAYPDDYTEKRIEEAKEDSSIFVRRYSQWDTLPDDKYSPETFKLSLGDAINRAKVLETEEDEAEELRKGLEVIEIPVDYKMDFMKDLDSAIRDLAGRPTLSIHPFIVYRHKLQEAMQRGPAELELEHPFTKEISTLQDGGTFDPAKLLIPMWKKRVEEETVMERKAKYTKIYNALKGKPRFIHTDLAISGMAGMAMGYVDDYIEVVRRNEQGAEYRTRMPVIVIEFMLRIIAPLYGEIEIASVRNLIHELRSYGYRVQRATFDQYQSVDSQQQLNRAGIDSGHLSADRDPAVYNAYKDAIYEDRLITYYYDPAYWETIKLEKNEHTGKIDHPKSGSKDVADAVAGVCFLCVQQGPLVPNPPPVLGKLDGGKVPASRDSAPIQGDMDDKDEFFNSLLR